MKDFKEIARQETNEFTAFILMLGVLSEKLSDIADLISTSNKLSKEILSCLKDGNLGSKKEIIILEPMTPEDYMS